MRRLAATDDSGFTLIELLITFVVMGVIFVPLANFFIQYLDTYNQTQQRLSVSHDLQIAAVYFSEDVANTGLRNQATGQTTFAPQQSVWTSGIANTFCGAPTTGIPLLLLKWDEETVGSGAGADTIDSVEYLVNATTLHRLTCRQPSSGAPTVSPDATIVHNLLGIPQLSCSSTCTAATPPTTMTLAISVQSTSTDTSGTSVALTGRRRQA